MEKRSGLFEFWLRFGSITGFFKPAPSPKPCQKLKNPRSKWLQYFFKRSRHSPEKPRPVGTPGLQETIFGSFLQAACPHAAILPVRQAVPLLQHAIKISKNPPSHKASARQASFASAFDRLRRDKRLHGENKPGRGTCQHIVKLIVNLVS